MAKWYENLKWRCLVDMHIPDHHESFMKKFCASEYAENMKRGGVELAELYTGNCLGICFFPTKVGHKHKGIGENDLVKDTFYELGKRNIEKMPYFNIWSRWAFDTYPEWRVIQPDGHNSLWENGKESSRFGICCINSDGYKDYVKKQIEQIVSDYEGKGLWIDMLGWFNMVCHCDSCKKKFRKKTGLDIPKEPDWNSGDWAKFMRFREESVTEFADMITGTAKKIKPEIYVVFNCAAWQADNIYAGIDENFLQKNEYLAGDFYGNFLQYSTTCKVLNNLSPNKPIEFMTSRCVELNDHTTLKSKDEMINSVYASIAYNAAFVMIDAINPDGTMEKKVYENLGELKKEAEPLYKYWNPRAKMMSDVAFYTNLKSSFDPRGENSHYIKDKRHTITHLNVLAKSMISEHIAYDFIFKPNLSDAIKEKKAIILSDVFILDEDEVRLFKEFVKNGGNLIITGLTGMFDKTEGRRKDFALSEIMGVTYLGETEFDFSYFNPTNSKLFEGYNSSAPMISYCNSTLTKLSGAAAMANLTVPWSHSKNAHLYASAISNPPKEHTEYPAVTINSYGKGKVMYISSPFECDEKVAQQKVFTNHVKYMMNDEPVYSAVAPSWMDTTLYDDGNGKYRALFLNAMEKYYECEARNIEMTINIKGLTKAKSAKDEREIKTEKTDNGIRIFIDSIKDFEMIILS